jgi:hypothetical protein
MTASELGERWHQVDEQRRTAFIDTMKILLAL